MNDRANSLIQMMEKEWNERVHLFNEAISRLHTNMKLIGFPKPEFKVNNRGSRTMAYANTPALRFISNATDYSRSYEVVHSGKITIMEFMYDQEKDVIIDTIRHEIAHILATYFGGRCHDKTWKNICRIIGATPTATCSEKLNFINAPLRKEKPKFTVYCSCGSYKITKNMYNKIVNNESRYSCRKCKTYVTVQEPITAKIIK